MRLALLPRPSRSGAFTSMVGLAVAITVVAIAPPARATRCSAPDPGASTRVITAIHTVAPGFVIGAYLTRDLEFVLGPRITWTRWGEGFSGGAALQTLWTSHAATLYSASAHASTARLDEPAPCSSPDIFAPFFARVGPAASVGYAATDRAHGPVFGVGFFAVVHLGLTLFVPVHGESTR